MGWPEDKFQEIFAAEKDERARLVEQLVTDHLKIREWLHLDLKEVRADQQGAKDMLGNLAKEASAFANEDGGLIVWGFVDPGKKDGGKPAPLEDVDAINDQLIRMAPESTQPTVPDVRSLVAPLAGGRGYIVTVVGRSERGPHRARLGPDGVKDHYFRRRSDRATKMSHDELEEVFGRRPRPLLVPRVTVNVLADFLVLVWDIWNRGPGIALGVTLEVRIRCLNHSGVPVLDGGELQMQAHQRDARVPEPVCGAEPTYGHADVFIPINSRPIRSEDGHCTMMDTYVRWRGIEKAVRNAATAPTVLRFEWVLGAYSMRSQKGAFRLDVSVYDISQWKTVHNGRMGVEGKPGEDVILTLENTQ